MKTSEIHILIDWLKNRGVIIMENDITIRKVTLKFEINFDKFVNQFETISGKFDETVLSEIIPLANDAVSKIKSMTGLHEIMIYSVLDQSKFYSIYGFKIRLRRYTIGNTGTAALMTNLIRSAALYTPLEMIVYESGPELTFIEYNLPLTYDDEIGDEVAHLGIALDQRLRELISKAAIV